MKGVHGHNQQRSAIFFTKVMYDLSVHLFGKAAVRETGLLPVICSLGIRDLRMSLPLICESTELDTAKSNFQVVECKIKLGWFHIAVAWSGFKCLLLGNVIGYKLENETQKSSSSSCVFTMEINSSVHLN